MSFLDIVFNYRKLVNNGYSELFLIKVFIPCSLPFFLFLMTALASILTMNTLKTGLKILNSLF